MLINSVSKVLMCGRFSLFCGIESVGQRFSVEIDSLKIEPRYNIAPSEDILVILQDTRRRLAFFRWGLIPFWAKEPGIGNRMINARVETISQKPAFRRSLIKKRCVILADGFYEWRKDNHKKVPMYIRLKSHEPFGFAGLWDEWDPSQGEKISSCTIITTESNELVSKIHSRMPVILVDEAEENWLDHTIEDSVSLVPWLKPYPSEEMEAYEVSRAVNSPRYKGPDCIKPLG